LAFNPTGKKHNTILVDIILWFGLVIIIIVQHCTLKNKLIKNKLKKKKKLIKGIVVFSLTINTG